MLILRQFVAHGDAQNIGVSILVFYTQSTTTVQNIGVSNLVFYAQSTITVHYGTKYQSK